MRELRPRPFEAVTSIVDSLLLGFDAGSLKCDPCSFEFLR